MSQREFDRYSNSYAELLKDSLRDSFSGAQAEFFHLRKRDLIRHYFQRRRIDTRSMRYLDLGCGKGELLRLLQPFFGHVAGCDPSAGMLDAVEGIEVCLQSEENKIPFSASSFDFVTAAAVYHHVPPALRTMLTQEVKRVLKPGGVFAIIEHNPFNPVTRLIVSRTPVDADAVFLTASETRRLMASTGFAVDTSDYFLYFPMRVYESGGRHLEKLLTKLPLGGQYAVFGINPANSTK